MKKYIVINWIDYAFCKEWGFEDQKESLDFYKNKINNLSKERKEDNKVLNLKDENSYGYTWQDQYGRVLEFFKKWKDMKNED